VILVQHYNVTDDAMTAQPMLDAIRPGRDEPADDAGTADTLLRHAPVDGEVFAGSGGRANVAAGLALAIGLHVLFLMAVLAGASDPFGAGGTDLEAVSVEVALVPASALESRASRATEMVASAAAVEQLEGTAPTAAPETPSAPDFAEQAQPEDQPRKRTPSVEPAEATASEPVPPTLPELALTKPDPTPPDLDAVTLPVREPEPPERVKPRPTPPTAASASAETGGATSHAADGVNRRAQAAAAASAGSVRAFTKGVVEALGKTRPKGLRHNARGTAMVAFAIAEGGGLEFVRVAKSSGHDVLDDAALTAVRKTSFPIPPSGMTLAQRTYEVPYHFR
jgi:protein TonB